MSKLLKSKFFLGAMVVTVMFVGVVAVNANDAAADCTVVPTVRVGSRGANVMCVQTIVGATADGAFGPLTKASVMAWQSGHNLTADGVVGPLTAAAMNAGAVGGSFPAGCSSASGFSSTTGLPCTSAGTFPAGCTSASGFSPTTGASCAGSSTLPAGCSSTAGFSPTTGVSCSTGVSSNGPLVGGAGSLDDVQFVSSLSDEQVAEGASDAKVAGYTVTADNGSDLSLSAMKFTLEMTAGTGSDKLTDYVDSVTVWQGSTKLGSADAADFSENSNVYTKTINLSSAVVRADKDSDFFVTVDSASNIDGTDLGNNTWTLTLTDVRFEDATGAIITDSTTGDIGATVTFSFETIATAEGLELKVSSTSGTSGDAVNKGHVVDIDDTSDTNDVPLLAFDLKATGKIQNIQDIPVKLVSTGTGQIIDQASSFSLWKDGVQIDTVNDADLTTTLTGAVVCTTVNDATGNLCYAHFDDVDFDMSDGTTSHFVVKANVRDTSATLVAGDTLTVTLGALERAQIDAEDANGDSLSGTDLTGTASADAIAFFDTGIMVKLVGTPTAVISHVGDIVGSGADDDDQGTFKITFDVTAFGSDAYVDGTSPALTGGGTATDIDIATTAGTPVLVSSTIVSPTSATLTGTINADARFKVADGDTEQFTITAVVRPSTTADATVNVSILNILYALTDVDGDTLYTFNLADYKTPDLFLNAN